MNKVIPILLNGEVVRAILAGLKTNTRRPIEVKVGDGLPDHVCGAIPEVRGKYHFLRMKNGDEFGGGNTINLRSPFGEPGDVLWVRETFRVLNPIDDPGCCIGFQYRADYAKIFVPPLSDDTGILTYATYKWTPSIHMPKEACRIKLKVKLVWVERLQSISEDGAYNEGCYYKSIPAMYPSATAWFHSIWESIYDAWGQNPWVWCCEFEVCK